MDASHGELSAHPHTQASQMVYEYPSVDGRTLKGVSQPLRFDGERPSGRQRPPGLGEHTREVLLELKYSDEDIAELLKLGAVQLASERAGSAI